jgi:hypothetical protein
MPDFLPDQYVFSHEYDRFLNDILTGFVKHGEEAGLFETTIDLKDEAHSQALASLPDEEKRDWLTANGYASQLREATYKHVILALLSDFCHFVFEALGCARKGKLTVAYSLLRKPFKDNLFYFEWLLADPDGFLNTFAREGPEKLEEYRTRQALRFPIVETAVSRTSKPGMFDAKFMDDLRYDRKMDYGLAASWDQANHLITTNPAIRTENENFNFVFVNPMDGGHWEFLYFRLPMLLYYAVEVVEALIARLLSQPELLLDATSTRREVGYMLWMDGLGAHDLALEPDPCPLPDCPDCGAVIVLDKANMLSFYNEQKITCPACGKVHDASDASEETAT